MSTDPSRPDPAAHIVNRLDPLVVEADGDGNLRNARVPEEAAPLLGFAHANNLNEALPAPVGRAWTIHARAALAEGRIRGALAVLDAESYEVWALPAPCASFVTLIAHRGTLEKLPPRLSGAATIGTITEHVWGVLDALSRGQLTTLRAIARGMDNEGIAKGVHRTKRAVEWHIRSLYLTLRRENREDLAAIGRRAGLHQFGDDAWMRVLAARPARRSRDADD